VETAPREGGHGRLVEGMGRREGVVVPAARCGIAVLGFGLEKKWGRGVGEKKEKVGDFWWKAGALLGGWVGVCVCVCVCENVIVHLALILRQRLKGKARKMIWGGVAFNEKDWQPCLSHIIY
jgi:hypothetical protein